jgi:hypothetical protein
MTYIFFANIPRIQENPRKEILNYEHLKHDERFKMREEKGWKCYVKGKQYLA